MANLHYVASHVLACRHLVKVLAGPLGRGIHRAAEVMVLYRVEVGLMRAQADVRRMEE